MVPPLRLLEYNDLTTCLVPKQYTKVCSFLNAGDYRSAELKKLTGTCIYRAKLDHSNRILLQLIEHQGQKCWLILEIIPNHAYHKSRFLNGAEVREEKISSDIETQAATKISYLHPEHTKLNILDKIISFDDLQQTIYQQSLPAIIIGTAGSGKTMLTLEKLKNQQGNILYVTHSGFLVTNARNLYYANNYNNPEQEIDFLSFQELLETIEIPATKEICSYEFNFWLKRQYHNRVARDANKLFEEFKGVITGSQITKAHLSQQEYLNLGVKQSIYPAADRELVYQLFEKYLRFLQEQQYHDLNILSWQYLAKSTSRYDVVVVDEIQDFTMVQLHLILSLLTTHTQFLLCGDSNQIVHPNFFSWAKIKSYFYKQNAIDCELKFILTNNYRNSMQVTELANRILKAKSKRFGSIDKESNYLVRANETNQGIVQFFASSEQIIAAIDNKIKRSTKSAIIVLTQQQKDEAREHFQTPLIFTIQEAKGLEYDNVVLYNFVSSATKEYAEIARDVSKHDLQQELTYARGKDKTDKSLEVYKFYINAFYVAITRAISNVYILEAQTTHKLFNLLGLQEATLEQLSLTSNESSLQEWQIEATKLAAQGKTEQAAVIRETIVKTSKPPWEVIDEAKLLELQEQAENSTNKQSKQAKILLLEYAVVYDNINLLAFLQGLEFQAAKNPVKSKTLVENKYFLGFNSSNTKNVINQVNQYGINFRNIFNLTPLMSACLFGNATLLQELAALGADKNLLDNCGRNALQIALNKAWVSEQYAKLKLGKTYSLIAAENISINVDNKLIKIDNKLMEFFLLNLFLARFGSEFTEFKDYKARYIYFTAVDLAEGVAKFSEQVLHKRRKRRDYISSVLAKNEVFRNGPYNRKLFLRLNRGQYTLNPNLAIKIAERWVNVYTLLKCARFTPKVKKVC